MSVQETPTELWGGETTKAVANFPVSGERVPLPVVRWLGRIKGNAARVNAELGLLDAELAEKIAAAGDEIAAGKHDAQFPIDVFQTGSGTSSNMNANEVIATLSRRAPERPREHGAELQRRLPERRPPRRARRGDEHAAARARAAREQLRRQGRGVQGPRQVRPHAPDGRRPGHARPGVRRLRGADPARPPAVENALPQVAQIPLGGTATGTGLNTHKDFAAKVREKLSADTGLTISAPEDPFEAQGNRDALVELSGALKVVAVSLIKIAGDLALMGSGPRVGIGEIFLPELQKGSSIMPGKVNPVLPEVVLQVGAQVIGNDTAITIGGLQGQFELNVRIPLMARNLLQSIHLLSTTSKLFAEKCVDGIEPNLPGLEALRRGHARRRDRAEPVHRLRQGRRHRQGGRGLRRHAARGRAQARRRRGDARQGARPAQDRGGFALLT